jgi:hypothetical protein
MITEDAIRTALLACWGRQTCKIKPETWPDVLKKLFTKQGSGGPDSRGSQKPVVDDAVAMLLAFLSEPTQLLTANEVWLAFPRLDRAHCEELAHELTELASAAP